jgi:hypothetical protein
LGEEVAMRAPQRLPLVVLFGLLAACAPLTTKIAQIRERPGEYENRVVTIHGKVSAVTKLPFMEEALYEVDDGTGTLTVITPKDVPAEGSTVTVTGKIQSTLKIGGKSFGLLLVQSGDT